MSGLVCHCGSTDIDRDPSRGDAVCTSCGSVLEESTIVTEVQFAQDSRGASCAIGKLVSSEDGVAGGLNLGHRYGLSRESRATTLLNAKQNIQLLASKLHLNTRCIDIAFNFYKLALSRGFTKGRKRTHVVAACVYMVCRKEETAHMLLDLSDILQVNVYVLGKTYLWLSNALSIHCPAIDPSLYILRFANQLGFDDKLHEVAMTATRLVQRMKKDWMHTGRRPSGLCGAALLVAARMHNFNRTVDDIIKVVKVCSSTVRKRLAEFKNTPSSQLTIEEFMTIDLDEAQDPPAFKNAQKKMHDLDDESKMTEIKKQVSELENLIQKALESVKQKSKHDEAASDENLPIACDNVDQYVIESTIKSINEVILNDVGSDSALPNETNLTPLLLAQTESIADSAFCSDSTSSIFRGPEPSAESLGLKENIYDCMRVPDKTSTSSVDELEVTGLDDLELERYIMGADEYKQKNCIWHKVNADYLKEKQEKEERKAEEEKENLNKPDQKKKRCRQKRVLQEFCTVGDAIENMLQQKKISNKLDYGVLKHLNPENEPPAEVKLTTTCDVHEENVPDRRTVRSRVRPKVNPPQPPMSSYVNVKKGMSELMESIRKREKLSALAEDQDLIPEPLSRVLKLSNSEHETPTSCKQSSILHSEITIDLEDEEQEEIDDEDKNQRSAAELLGYHTEKEERKADEEKENANKPDQKKKRRQQKRVLQEHNTVGDSIENMSQQKTKSFKLDYGVLKHLDPENELPAEAQLTTTCEVHEENVPVRSIVRSRARPKVKPPQATVSLHIKKGRSEIIESIRKKEMLSALVDDQDLIPDSLSKVLKLSNSEHEAPMSYKEPSMSHDEITIDLEEEEQEEIDDDDDEDEDRNQISAAELLGYHTGGAVPDYYEYGEFQDDYDD